MIKQAREDLDQRPSLPEMGFETDQIRDQVEEEMPSVDELVAAPRYTQRPTATRPRTPRRVTRAQRRPPSGFEGTEHRRGNAIALVVAMALLVMGAAAFLVLAASGTG